MQANRNLDGQKYEQILLILDLRYYLRLVLLQLWLKVLLLVVGELMIYHERQKAQRNRIHGIVFCSLGGLSYLKNCSYLWALQYASFGKF